MSEKILAALRQLDAGNPNHWTAEGAPRLDTVRLLAGDQSVSREAINAAAPGFSRENMAAAGSAQQATSSPQPGGSEVSTNPASSDAPAAGNAASQGVGDGTQGAPGAGDDADTEGEADSSEEAFAQQLANAKQRLADAQAAFEKARGAVAEAEAALDVLLEKEQERSVSTISEAVSGYMAQQARIRAERAARIEATRGVRLSDILPTRSRIDDALAQRPGRGNKRPTGI